MGEVGGMGTKVKEIGWGVKAGGGRGDERVEIVGGVMGMDGGVAGVGEGVVEKGREDDG